MSPGRLSVLAGVAALGLGPGLAQAPASVTWTFDRLDRIGGHPTTVEGNPILAQGPGRTAVGVRLNRVNYFKGAVRMARFTPRALAPAEFLTLAAQP